jgi:hypothetical protein
MTINNQLQVCKDYMVISISMHKPALILGHYFHVLAQIYTKFKIYLPSWTKLTKSSNTSIIVK